MFFRNKPSPFNIRKTALEFAWSLYEGQQVSPEDIISTAVIFEVYLEHGLTPDARAF